MNEFNDMKGLIVLCVYSLSEKNTWLHEQKLEFQKNDHSNADQGQDYEMIRYNDKAEFIKKRILVLIEQANRSNYTYVSYVPMWFNYCSIFCFMFANPSSKSFPSIPSMSMKSIMMLNG